MSLYFKIQENIIKIMIISFCALGAQDILPENHANWEVLHDGEIWVGCTEYAGSPWCKSRKTLPFSIEKISEILEDRGNYKNIFDRVTTSQVLEDNIVYIILDMPFPFSSRDYIVKYIEANEGNKRIYQWFAVDFISIPKTNNNVRLNNAAGEWRLTPINSDKTTVSYTWNGELLGDFPDWALTRAWTTQGNEVLVWLTKALQD